MIRPQAFAITVDGSKVSGLLQVPRKARFCYVLAHGAGAGMAHPFMAAIADGLGERGIATLRYQFPYMEQGRKRPDTPKLAQATVRAAVAEASRLLPNFALVAGGKSFGGRMTSQAQPFHRCPESEAWCFSAFRFIRLDTPRTSVAIICSTSKSQCCSCREPAMRSPTPNS
jgi:hypothetical protein